MTRLVLATHNPDKFKEIRYLLHGLEAEILSVDEVLPGFDVTEDGESILVNAAKKALETAKAANCHVLADDTGLFIKALNGDPGVFAARFAGEGCSYADNRRKVLDLMHDIEDRQAEFKTVAVLAGPDGVIAFREGVMPGQITTAERGGNGFGYDSVFEVGDSGRTYAEMDEKEKNACSHRGKALAAFLPFLVEYFKNN